MPEQGKVKWFSNVKGYGFVEKEGSDKDIFIHYSAILSDGYRTLDQDEEVTFDIVEGERGPQATNLIRVKKPPKEKPAEKAETVEAPKAEEAPAETAPAEEAVPQAAKKEETAE